MIPHRIVMQHLVNTLLVVLALAPFPVVADDAHRVLVIGIDGCRLDAIEAARTPQLDALVEAGTRFEGTDILSPHRTDEANTISGPGWSNLLTGVWPDKHGVIDNKFTNPQYDRYPHFFQHIREVRPDACTASFSSWPPIARIITRGATLAENYPTPDPDDVDGYCRGDVEAAQACMRCLQERDPVAVVLYFGQVDECGHASGFHLRVPEYVAAIERVDEQIGMVRQAVARREQSRHENWLTIVCTDHGGSGTDHGNGHDNPDIRRTFLIVSGASALRGRSDAPTWQVDLVPTALKHLGIAPRPEWGLDGQAVGLR